jgi:flagellar motor switch protein FliN
MNGRSLIEAAAEELGAIVGALLEAPTEVRAAPEEAAADAVEPRWVVRLTFEGALTGMLSVGFDEVDGGKLAQLVMGLDEAPPEEAIADTLRELCSQGLTALGERDDFKGLRLGATHILFAPPATVPARFQVTAGERFSGAFALWDESVVAIRPRDAAGLAPLGGLTTPANLDVILDIDLPLSVRFGQTDMTLAELTSLGPGSVIDLGRSPDDPVDVLVHGRLVARGEVVVVSGNYGVRITDVISAADRLRTVAS